MFSKQLCAVLISTFAMSSVGASDVKSEREAGFKGSKRAISAIKDDLAAGNLAAVAKSASSMAEFAEKIPTLFPPGSKGGFFSAAKAEIWENFPDFLEKSKSFQLNAQALSTLASSSSPDKAALNTAFTKVTDDCKGCHQSYKRGR
jgi:cytochrome c556